MKSWIGLSVAPGLQEFIDEIGDVSFGAEAINTEVGMSGIQSNRPRNTNLDNYGVAVACKELLALRSK